MNADVQYDHFTANAVARACAAEFKALGLSVRHGCAAGRFGTASYYAAMHGTTTDAIVARMLKFTGMTLAQVREKYQGPSYGR